MIIYSFPTDVFAFLLSFKVKEHKQYKRSKRDFLSILSGEANAGVSVWL